MNELLKNAIIHIIRVLNIKDPDKLVNDRIKAELSTISDIPKYIGYVEKNYSKLEYLTGYQKFLEITKKYKEGVLITKNKTSLEQNKSRAYEIAQKVKQVTSVYVESEYNRNTLGFPHKKLRYESFKQVDDKTKNIFTDGEISILRRIGELGKVIKLQNSSSGKDDLEIHLNRILDKITLQPKTSNQILYNEKKVLEMAKEIVA